MLYRYVHQAIHVINKKLDDKVREVLVQVEKIQKASSFITSADAAAETVYIVRSRVLEICIIINDQISLVLEEILKGQDYMSPLIKDISKSLMTIRLRYTVGNESNVENLKLGLYLTQMIESLKEVVEKTKRLLTIQAAILTNQVRGEDPSKIPFWSVLLFDPEFINIIELVAISFQKMIKNCSRMFIFS
jgi:hypothetical protein